MIRGALAYARRGVAVLPLVARGKEPLVGHGVHDASIDETRIHAWWHRWPNANVGIAVPPHWFVVDVDPRNGGDEALEALEVQHGQLPPTLTQRTGSGGAHLLFVRPEGFRHRGKLTHGVDLLGIGRYILAAPSIHPCGGRYAWTSPRRATIADAPTWLLDVARAAEAPRSAPRSAPDDGRPRTSVIDRARRYLAQCPGAISGSGGHAATFVTAQRLVRGFDLDPETAYDLLSEWNSRCEPPWSEHELRHKIRQAVSVGRMPFGVLLSGRRGAA